MPELLIRTPDGSTRTIKLTSERQSLGRSGSNELCYADDAGLSRQHLAFEPQGGGGWLIRDLGSKNGTYLNGARIAEAHLLRSGDRVNAGHIVVEYHEGSTSLPMHTVVFVDDRSGESPGSTVVTNLKQVLAATPETAQPEAAPRMHALIRAGRELAGHRPLDELFEVILDLAMEAVNADRGVLMTLENSDLVMRAARGDDFRISSYVRDRVLNEHASLLVRDAQLDEAFRNRVSIVQQRVRSMMAVPLEANDRVIGLIYLDTPNLLRPFNKQDLGLVTVLANVAAIRIEHARLIQVEHAERMLAKELQQAAEIQRRLLPAEAPEIAGFDIAGHNAPSRMVGGDYYDFVPYSDGRMALLVADVSGKGMPAALLMSSLQARVQVLSEENCGPAEMLTRLNRIVQKSCPDNRFITAFYSVLDPATGELAFSSAGHNPPLLLRCDGTLEKLLSGGLPLGLFAHSKYDERQLILQRGDALVLYSDGISEAPRAEDSEEFGEDRLEAILRDKCEEGAAEIVAAVNEAITAWTSGAPPADDITLVVARRV
jgi:serine phosphatase RsbU (regulator of sigma subunit)